MADWYDICKGEIEKKQTVVLNDGKFTGSKRNYKITKGGFWGCESIEDKMIMKEDCRALP